MTVPKKAPAAKAGSTTKAVPKTPMGYRERFLAWPMWLRITTFVVVGLIIIGLLCWLITGIFFTRTPVFDQVENVPSRTTSEVQVDGDPFAALGIHSATEFIVMATKNPSLWDALKLVRPDMTRYDVAGLAAAEQEDKPSPWIATVPAGTPIGNTGINGKGHAYSVSGYRVRKGDNTFLVDKNGNIWLKVSCGNPVAPSAPSEAKKPKKPKKPKKTEKCPPAPPGFNPRTPDGGSKVFQPPQDDQERAKATDPAPGIVPGVPDAIADDQQDNAGSTNPTPHGTISDDPPPAGPPTDDGAGDVTSGTVPGLW